jgi:glucose-6-phosphate isomerase
MAIDTDTERQLLHHQTRFTQADHRLESLFSRDPDRAASLTFEAPHLIADFSKQRIDQAALKTLVQLAEQRQLTSAIQHLFAGQPVNNTEQRAALHMALRGHVPSDTPAIAEEVKRTQKQMANFVNAVHSKTWRGKSDAPITDIVNIGIGGSDLGPAMATASLQDYQHPDINCHFVSNVDPSQIDLMLARLNPERTLFVIVSKSFGTQETMQNAQRAIQWFKAHGGEDSQIARHFVAVTTNCAAALDFGIAEENIFTMWDWVGGRYSLWSAAGISIALATSWQVFSDLLAGAAEMDRHFLNTPLAQNVPVLAGLLSVWYRNYWKAESQVVLPYSQPLNLLPSHLQQLDMESLGKQVKRNGEPVSEDTGAIIWGCAGTNGQHSFHQLLHQGTTLIPAEFIAITNPARDDQHEPHQLLLANCFAQSRALMTGKSLQEVEQEMRAAGASDAEINRLARHKVVPGNRPSTTLLLNRLTPKSLGSLLAYYEAKVFVQSVIWDINAFDQWGVELGKQLSRPIASQLLAGSDSGAGQANAESAKLDPSTQQLISLCLTTQDRKN